MGHEGEQALDYAMKLISVARARFFVKAHKKREEIFVENSTRSNSVFKNLIFSFHVMTKN